VAENKNICLIVGAFSIFLFMAGCFFGCQCGYNNFFGAFALIGAAGLILACFSLR